MLGIDAAGRMLNQPRPTAWERVRVRAHARQLAAHRDGDHGAVESSASRRARGRLGGRCVCARVSASHHRDRPPIEGDLRYRASRPVHWQTMALAPPVEAPCFRPGTHSSRGGPFPHAGTESGTWRAPRSDAADRYVLFKAGRGSRQRTSRVNINRGRGCCLFHVV